VFRVRLPRDLEVEMNAAAARRGTTPSQVMRDALARCLASERHAAEVDADEASHRGLEGLAARPPACDRGERFTRS
jgi:predicted transcriptional regulator